MEKAYYDDTQQITLMPGYDEPAGFVNDYQQERPAEVRRSVNVEANKIM